MDKHYILQDKKAMSVDLLAWAKWLETADRHVAKDEIGDVRISTVFLGLNHQWGDGPPLLFETLVFGGKFNDEMDRYSTWEEAKKGHAEMVERVRG